MIGAATMTGFGPVIDTFNSSFIHHQSSIGDCLRQATGATNLDRSTTSETKYGLLYIDSLSVLYSLSSFKKLINTLVGLTVFNCPVSQKLVLICYSAEQT